MSVKETTPGSILAFNPTRAVVLSELSTREKDKYYDMLLKMNVKFYVDPDSGQYVGNVRMLGPNVKRAAFEEKKKDLSGALPFEERLKRLHDGGTASVRIQGIESFNYNEFVKFVALIASNGEVVRPKARSLTWLMRSIEDLYDARFAFEKVNIERDGGSDAGLSGSMADPTSAASVAKRNAVTMFPAFAVRRMCTMQGLRSLVDQTCWDLLYNIHLQRSQHLEVELFARFLKEHYDYDDLLFFLYVRSVVAKTLNINFKTRWGSKETAGGGGGGGAGGGMQPAPLFLSYRECVRVAHIIYGSQGNESICRRFVAMVTTQLVGQVTETTDSRRIDMTQFMHLAVIGYHYAQNMLSMGSEDGGSRQGGELEAEAELDGYDLSRGQGQVQEPHEFQNQQDGEDGGQGLGGVDRMVRELDMEDRQLQEQLEHADGGDGMGAEVAYHEHRPNEFEELLSDRPARQQMGSALAQAQQAQEEEYRRFVEQEQRRAAEDGQTGSVATGTGTGTSLGQTVTNDDFIALQMDREKEFLEFVCEPLEAMVAAAGEGHGEDEEAVAEAVAVAAEIAQAVVDEVADQLRSRVNNALDGFEPASLESFDERLVGILQSRELILEIETARDVLLADLQAKRMGAEQGQGLEEPQGAEVADVPESVVADASSAQMQPSAIQDTTDGQDGDGATVQSGTSTADSYANVQRDRENEFLELLCEPLAVLPEEQQTTIVGELAVALRQHLNAALDGFAPTNLAHYDETIVEVLQSASLLEQMEALCLELIQAAQ